MRILGIETSCDETGIAIYDGEAGLMVDLLYSQVSLHADYGGVVPELASRDHIRKTLPMIDEALSQSDTTSEQIDGIAYTAGPGLVGALMVGAAIAKGLGLAWQVPVIGVNHMEGHLLAPMLEEDPPKYPFIALLVSGGHTQLVDVEQPGRYRLLGDSVDDAAGEAFDKVAKMLGLGYPGGPEIARLAEGGEPDRFRFPRPMTNRPGLDFSFSGLKTFTFNLMEEVAAGGELTDQARADIACGFQQAVVDTLVIKCRRALEQSGSDTLVIAGGVSANSELRSALDQMSATMGARLSYARPSLCTDNGAMIAFAGYQRLRAGDPGSDLAIFARPRWPIDQLPPMGG